MVLLTHIRLPSRRRAPRRRRTRTRRRKRLSRKRIDELSEIEFSGARAVTRYANTGRDLARDFSRELEFGADTFEAELREVARDKGHPLLAIVGAPDIKWKAKRIARRLRRAAELQKGAAAEMVRFHAQFRREFEAALRPAKKPKAKFNFEDD